MQRCARQHFPSRKSHCRLRGGAPLTRPSGACLGRRAAAPVAGETGRCAPGSPASSARLRPDRPWGGLFTIQPQGFVPCRPTRQKVAPFHACQRCQVRRSAERVRRRSLHGPPHPLQSKAASHAGPCLTPQLWEEKGQKAKSHQAQAATQNQHRELGPCEGRPGQGQESVLIFPQGFAYTGTFPKLSLLKYRR